MNQNGHVKGVTEDDNGYRQFIVNCLGNNDQRKYFSISPFGIDFNIPVDTRTLTTDSRNKDESYNLGVLNQVKVEDLEPGECAIFSTNANGAELKSFIKLRNSGVLEINGDSDNIVRFSKLKEEYDKTKAVLDAILTTLQSPINEPGNGAPSAFQAAIISAVGTKETGDISTSKVDNVKTN